MSDTQVETDEEYFEEISDKALQIRDQNLNEAIRLLISDLPVHQRFQIVYSLADFLFSYIAVYLGPEATALIIKEALDIAVDKREDPEFAGKVFANLYNLFDEDEQVTMS